MGNNRGPMLPNLEPFFAAGIDPKTGLPLKMGNKAGAALKENIRRAIRVQDEQDAINRYVWYNLPGGLSSQELERFLYYKGQLAIAYIEGLKQFLLLPYALNGTIDPYGRFNQIHLIPFTNGTTENEKKQMKRISDYLSDTILTVQHDVVLPEKLTPEMMTGSAVILRDYTNQYSQTLIPRQELNDALVELESDALCYMRTGLLNATGVRAMRVDNEDSSFQVYEASKSLNDAAIAGEKYIPIVGTSGLDFQDLTDGTVGKSEEFLLAMQALDNIRLGLLGIDNGGIFEKKAHLLQDEANMAAGAISFALQDGLAQRQKFCDIVNSIWPIGICCEVSEIASGQDKNMDGEISQRQDQSGTAPGDQPAIPAGGDENV